MKEKNPTAFISYSRDSTEHQDRVLNLANKLRSEGIDCAESKVLSKRYWQ